MPGATEDARRRLDRTDAARTGSGATDDAPDPVCPPIRTDGGRDPLEEVATILSHDLQNSLTVVRGYLDLAREADDEEPIERALAAVERAEEIAEGAVILARTGERLESTESVDLADVAERAWTTVSDPGATLRIVDDVAVVADERGLARLLENLFRNAVEHGGTGSQPSSGDQGASDPDGVTVRIGALENGFYVEDDGPGIPEAERERVFDHGYSGADEHHGVGLTIVRRLAGAHGWSVAAVESASGGVRIEVTGVALAGAEDNA